MVYTYTCIEQLSQEGQGFVQGTLQCDTQSLEAKRLVSVETHMMSRCRTCRSRSVPNPASATGVGLRTPWASRWFGMHPHPPPPPLQPKSLTQYYSAMATDVSQGKSVLPSLNQWLLLCNPTLPTCRTSSRVTVRSLARTICLPSSLHENESAHD